MVWFCSRGAAGPDREEAPVPHIQRPPRIGSRRPAPLAGRLGDPNGLSFREVCLQPQRSAPPLPEQYAGARAPGTTVRGCEAAPVGDPVPAPAPRAHLFVPPRAPGPFVVRRDRKSVV